MLDYTKFAWDAIQPLILIMSEAAFNRQSTLRCFPGSSGRLHFWYLQRVALAAASPPIAQD